jgi:hypothetical protein
LLQLGAESISANNYYQKSSIATFDACDYQPMKSPLIKIHIIIAVIGTHIKKG